jgi:hypothetical protein
MATARGIAIQITGFVAATTLASYQWCPVKPASTADQVKLATATTDKIIGLLVNNPTSGQACEIVGLGNAKARAAASVSAGDMLVPNSTGYLKAATAGRAVAMALAASSNAGDIIPVLVIPQKL